VCSRPTSIMLLRKVLLLCVKIVYGFLLMLVAYRGSAEPLLLSPGMMYTCSSNGLEAVMGRLLGASSNVGARDGALGARAAAPFPLELQLCFRSARWISVGSKSKATPGTTAGLLLSMRLGYCDADAFASMDKVTGAAEATVCSNGVELDLIGGGSGGALANTSSSAISN
jgi:hypothetical protein